jgi:Tol biopolymer transport system component
MPSPDGKLLAFKTFSWQNSELWVMDIRGGSARKIFTPSSGEWFTGVAWAPNSRRIAYQFTRATLDKGLEGVIVSRDVDGGSTAPILVDSRLVLTYGGGGGIQWLPDGRLLFSLKEPPPNLLDANLWSLRVDPATGRPEGKPGRITGWAGGRPGPVGATADGKRLLVERVQAQSDVWFGEIEDGGRRMKAPRRLTLDVHHDRPAFWMPDSRRIVFSSDRNGSLDLLVESLESGDALPLVIGAEDTERGRLLPQKDSFLFVETPAGDNPANEITIKRADLSGGSVETMFKLPDHDTKIDCPSDPTASCLISERSGDEVVLYEMDGVKGRGRVVARIGGLGAAWSKWSLSPDGSRVAYLEDSTSGFLIKILNLADSSTIELLLKGRNNVQSVAWAPDGKSLFAANNDYGKCAIFRVDFQGNTRVLLESGPGGEWLGNPLPSLDGRYLAYQEIGFYSDYWILEGF